MTDPTVSTIDQAVANPNATTLIMGEGGAGKSSLIATGVEYVWQKYGCWSSVYLIDGGGVPTQISALVNRGMAKLWRLRTRGATDETKNTPLETMYKASRGYWPRRINARTGETAPDVELIAPTTSVFVVRCGQCAEIEAELTHKVQLDLLLPTAKSCAKCRAPLTVQSRVIQRDTRVTPGFEKRGGCFFDGISSAGDWGMEAISGLNLGGEKSALGGFITSGGMQFGTGNRAQVGFIQTQQLQWLTNGGSIPNLKVPAVWTSLIAEATDDGLQVAGPKLMGQAKTTSAPACVGNLLEAVAETDAHGVPVRRLYIKAFTKDGVRHLLKPRAYPALLPAYLEDPDTDDPQQPRFVNFNLGRFFELMEQARLTNEAMIDAKFADAPGIVSEIEEFGGAAYVPPVGGGVGPAVGGPKAVAGGPKAAPAPRGATPARRGPVATPAAAVVTPAPAPAPVAPITMAEVDAIVETLGDAPITSTPGKAPAPSSVPVATPAPVQTSPTTPQAQAPPAPRPPMRAPVAAPAGRRPVPVVVKPTGGA